MGTSRLRLDADYYGVLGLEIESSDEEIRRAYRRLVLEAHPDKNPQRRAWAEQRIRELIEAYDVLGQSESRALFDAHLRSSGRSRSVEPFFFQRETPGARALRVLHFLLNGQPALGLELLLEQEEEYGRGYLEEYLAWEDYLDCLFLLAEHHAEKNDHLASAERLRALYHHHQGSTRRRHYHDEVVRRLKDLYLRKIPRSVEASLRVSYLLEAAEFGLDAREEERRLRLLFAAHVEVGNSHDASATLAELARRGLPESDLEVLRDHAAGLGPVPRRRRAGRVKKPLGGA